VGVPVDKAARPETWVMMSVEAPGALARRCRSGRRRRQCPRRRLGLVNRLLNGAVEVRAVVSFAEAVYVMAVFILEVSGGRF
jgi:hypothetical protein